MLINKSFKSVNGTICLEMVVKNMKRGDTVYRIDPKKWNSSTEANTDNVCINNFWNLRSK